MIKKLKIILLTLLIFFQGQLFSDYEFLKEDIEIWSDGTRMKGNLFIPRDENIKKWPTILMVHGWGGTKDHLNTAYATKFAAAGFMVMTFDYRGWGESDSRLVIYKDMPKPSRWSNKVKVEAIAIRELVDPLDQYEDIQSCLYFLEGDSRVDSSRIGIWGSSFGGGHAIMVGAKDPRIRVIVSQVGGMGTDMGFYSQELKKRLIKQARREEDPVPQGVDIVPGLRGTPHLGRMALYQPISVAKNIKVPTLIIDAENEELFDRRKNGLSVHNLIKGKVPTRYLTFPGRHYDIYGKNLEAVLKVQIDWFNEHLKQKK